MRMKPYGAETGSVWYVGLSSPSEQVMLLLDGYEVHRTRYDWPVEIRRMPFRRAINLLTGTRCDFSEDSYVNDRAELLFPCT